MILTCSAQKLGATRRERMPVYYYIELKQLVVVIMHTRQNFKDFLLVFSRTKEYMMMKKE